MAYKRNNRGILAMEEIVSEEAPIGTDISLNEVQDLNHVSEADDIMMDYSIMNELTDDRIDSVNALTEIHAALGDAEAGGGLMPLEAEAVQIAVEHFCKQAYVRSPGKISMEHFGGLTSRKQATRMAMEGITDAIKGMIKKIIDWIKRMVTGVSDSVVSMATGADNLVKTARRIKDSAKTIADKTIAANSKVMKDPKLCAFFTKSMAVVPVEHVLDQYQQYCKYINNNFKVGFIKEIGLRTYEASVAATKNVKEEVIAEKVSVILKELKQKALEGFVDNPEVTDENKEGLRYDLPFGQRHLSVVFTKNGDKYSGFALKVGEDPKVPKDIAEKGIATLNHKQILDITKAVEDQLLFGLYKHHKNTISDLEKIQSTVNKACNDISREQEREEHSVMFSVNFLKELMTSAVAMSNAAFKYDISVSRALLEYCDKSIRQHS